MLGCLKRPHHTVQAFQPSQASANAFIRDLKRGQVDLTNDTTVLSTIAADLG